ncbi:MAG: bifunctional 2-keto-4-hydroxyglutarate aldolase/2-keto-3-deoxy-6-phosphogluconate aldolase [Clostridiales bacterium]|nr:bifunctional 2-keto-4-hydroxyglutarate aldolase/2-keto-3-deoxy-6-phosphogluconate aldolase [Clostridiales bacterium]
MKSKEQVLQMIEDSGMVAVVRGETAEKARAIVESCIEGGIKAIELTFTVPFAHRVIEDLAMQYSDQILLGAGTVLDPETARIAILSGAQFVVAPHFNPETTKLCNRYRIANMAGILTVREAVEAMEAGVDVLKLFPGDLFGPAFIKDIRGPLPYARIMPTGGVSVSNAGDWIRAGAVAVGAGSSLMKGDVKANAAAFMEEIRKARG